MLTPATPIVLLKHAGLLGVLVFASIGFAQQTSDPMREALSLRWQVGPAQGTIAGKATLSIPPRHRFLDGPNTRRFLELNGNPPRDNHYTIAPDDLGWFAIFFFEPSGYVRDDEKLDANALLRTLKENDGPSNEERKRLGMQTLHTIGWHVPPHYDLETKRLEWGLRLRAEDGDEVINYTTRLLGRNGIMHATLVSDPKSLDREIVSFKSVLAGFGFASGERYSEFRSGDKVAQYGLGALIVGGAAAAAAKTGAGKGVMKVIGVAIFALGAAILGFLRRLFRR
jgi:uncharacterized membrane-anchored protein